MGGDFGLTRMMMALIRAHQRDVERNRKMALRLEAFSKLKRKLRGMMVIYERLFHFIKSARFRLTGN